MSRRAANSDVDRALGAYSYFHGREVPVMSAYELLAAYPGLRGSDYLLARWPNDFDIRILGVATKRFFIVDTSDGEPTWAALRDTAIHNCRQGHKRRRVA